MGGSETVRVIDQQLQLAEIDFLDRFDAVLQSGQSWVIGRDGRWDRAGVDVKFDQCVVAASDVSDVIGAFIESGLDVEYHDCYWSKSQDKAEEGIGGLEWTERKVGQRGASLNMSLELIYAAEVDKCQESPTAAGVLNRSEVEVIDRVISE